MTTTPTPILTEKGYVELDAFVRLGKNPIDKTGMSLGIELGMDYCSVDNTFCLVRTKSHVMSFDITPEQLEEMARLLREEIKQVHEGKCMTHQITQVNERLGGKECHMQKVIEQ